MRQNLLAWSVMAMAGAFLAWASRDVSSPVLAGTPQAEVSPLSLLPESAVAAFIMDGSAAHQPAISETAAWKSLEESGMRARVFDLLQAVANLAGPDVGRNARGLLETVMENGISGAVSVPAGDALQPYSVLVLHQAARFAEPLGTLLNRTVGRELELREISIEGRRVTQADLRNTPVQISWWTEADHLVFALGINAAEQVIATATGATADITANPHYAALRASDKFTVDGLAWLDTAALINRFGEMPFPEPPRSGPITIRDFLNLLGVANLQRMTMQSGYNGEAGWAHATVDVDGELSGLLSLLEQRQITLDDLPPLPEDCSSFFAASFNLSEAYTDVLNVVRRFADLAGEHAQDDMAEYDAMVVQVLGGDIRSVLLEAFGDVWCVYSDPTGMPIPIGFSPVVCFSVKDRDRLMNTIDRFLPLLERELDDEFQVRRSWKDGDLYFSFTIAGAPIVPTVIVTEDWVVGSLVPGAAQTFVMRQKGELKQWTPGDVQAASLASMPDSFTSISVSDPAPGYIQMLNFAPMAMSLFETQVLPNLPPEQRFQLPFGVADLPVAQKVVEPLFPNVAVSVRTETGVESWSRHSVPANPIGSVGSSAAVPVLVALLLPAVQQAREAARRTQSKNNLKMMALAMHNHHDVYRNFPRGTVENDDLEPDERLSWVYPLLPFLEQTAIHNRVDKESGWDSPANQQLASTAIVWLQNPSQRRDSSQPGSMDYVGIAGVGPDAASLPNDDPKAGIFGYDRVTRIRDITDGTSNTLMIGDSSPSGASWLAGGQATIRGFSQQPYLNGPDGIGSPHAGVVQFALADGSVRAVSVNIDDSVLEALATKAGREVISPF